MNTIAATGPNTEQIEFWNGLAGSRWVQHQQSLDASIGGIGEDALARAQIKKGERALDVGCGCGQTTLDIAHRVGPSGSVVGVDISSKMLDQARVRAEEAGFSNVRFENADAETHNFTEQGLDLIFSRFGVMFFNDPVAAFRNLGSTLRPGGRLTFACWRRLEENPWLVLPAMAASEFVELPPRVGPEDPGPFGFADEQRVQRILSEAGFPDVALEQRDGPFQLGGPNTLDGAVLFAFNVGPAANALENAAPEIMEKVAESVRGVLEPYYTGTAVEMPSSAWIVTATRP